MSIDQVEELIELHYVSVQLPPTIRDQIRARVEVDLTKRNKELVAQQTTFARRRQALADERKKLLRAHYAGAIPLDLLKTEQERIAQEIAATDSCLGDVESRLAQALTNLDQVLALIGYCHEAYLRASSSVRRQFNQAIFTALYVGDDQTVSGELAEPFQALFHPRLLTHTARA